MVIREKPLKRKNSNNPQIKSYTEAIRRGQNTYHIFCRDDGWEVKKIGRSSERGVFDTKNEALRHAEDIARRDRTEVIIHRRNGMIQERRSYEDDPHPPRN